MVFGGSQGQPVCTCGMRVSTSYLASHLIAHRLICIGLSCMTGQHDLVTSAHLFVFGVETIPFPCTNCVPVCQSDENR